MVLFGRPKEIKETLELLDQAKETLSDLDERLLKETVDEARRVLTHSKADMDEFVRQIREKKSTTKEWVYTYIINDAADKIESGNYHVYRGVLDHTGQAYREIFERCIKIMIEMGAYSKEWADEKIRGPVYRNLKTVG